MMTSTTGVRIFGAYSEASPDEGEYLTIGFSPSCLPLKKRWQHNGLSADFIGEYFRNFYVTRQEAGGGADAPHALENLCGAVKYIANELLENAMKFQDVHRPYSAQIFLSLHMDRLVFSVTNGISAERAAALQQYIHVLLHNDAQELYLEAMRASAKAEKHHYSGFGLLSMICDYSAKLGWKFSSYTADEDGEQFTTVTTMVILDT